MNGHRFSRGGARGPSALAPHRPATAAGGRARPEATGWKGMKRLFTDVDWSISYVAFLLYFVIVITYRFSGASFVIAIALGGLIFERGRRSYPYWLAWFSLFLLWGAVSFTQSAYPDHAWNQGVIEFGKLLLICLVAANVLTNAPRLRFFLIFFLFLYATHPIRGALFNTFLYGYTEESRTVWNWSWSNPNDMAALTFLPLGIAAGLLKDRSDWVRKGALASVAVIPFVILLTRSRGGFIALGVFALLTVLVNRRQQLRALAAVVVVGLGAALFAPEGTFERFTNFTTAVRTGDTEEAQDFNSMQQRLEIWRIARRIIADHQIFGVGLDVYNEYHRLYARASAETEIGGGMRDTHSTYLRVIAETGYPGFVLFIAPFLIAIVRSRSVRRRFDRTFPDRAERVKYLEAALIATLICGIFGSYAHTIFLWLALALLCIQTEDLRRAGRSGRRLARARSPLPHRSRLGAPVSAPR